MKTRLLLVSTLGAALLGVPAAFAGGGESDLAAARTATAGYHDLSTAQAAGYGLFKDAAGIACIDNPPEGGMGIHYVNGDYVGDTNLDPTKPEALVYAPEPNGHLKLVALEYIVFQAGWDANHGSRPVLFGHEFGLVPAPNRFGIPAFYELHVWVWKPNPSGMFYEWNPRVVC